MILENWMNLRPITSKEVEKIYIGIGLYSKWTTGPVV